MVIALHKAGDRLISDSLPDSAPIARATVEVTDSIIRARRFADAAALTAYLTARTEPSANWTAVTI